MSQNSKASDLNRRSFLSRSAVAAGAIGVAVPFDALLARQPAGGRPGRGPSPDYGPLEPAIDETTGLPLLLLPRHFRYRSFGWTGDWMTDGLPTPAAHDGMAAFPAGRGRIHLIRNHEVGDGPDAFAPDLAYDVKAGGGTVTLEFDTRQGECLGSWASISGTVRNCAGGPTPWGSWLTCEETTIGIGTGDLTKNHGYIFEVPQRPGCIATGRLLLGWAASRTRRWPSILRPATCTRPRMQATTRGSTGSRPMPPARCTKVERWRCSP